MSHPEETSQANGKASSTVQRLASFKLPRDLSLGREKAKPTKKVFTPNLNVTRNKNKGGASTSSDVPREDSRREDRRRGRGRGDRGRGDRGRGRGDNPNIIRSSGIFSEGLGAVERHSSRVSYGIGRDESSATLVKPTLRLKNLGQKVDNELEEQRIRSVCDGSSIQVEDFKSARTDVPVKLPMDYQMWSAPKPTVKQEPVVPLVKVEPEDGSADVDVKPLAALKLEAEPKEEADPFVGLLRSADPALILIKMPDTLSAAHVEQDLGPPRKRKGKEATADSEAGGSAEGKPAAEAAADNRPAAENNAAPLQPQCSLREMTEGLIGTFRVHVSGKITLALGHMKFDVESTTKSSFYQEVVSVAADDAARSAAVTALGPMGHKLCVVPGWTPMLPQRGPMRS